LRIPVLPPQNAQFFHSQTRACLKNVKTPKQRISFRQTALKNLEIHQVFLRFFALSGEKISRCWSFRHLSNKP